MLVEVFNFVNITNRFKIVLIIIIFLKTFLASANITFNDYNKVVIIFRNLNIK